MAISLAEETVADKANASAGTWQQSTLARRQADRHGAGVLQWYRPDDGCRTAALRGPSVSPRAVRLGPLVRRHG